MSLPHTPPKAPPIGYTARMGTRWEREKAAAGLGAFEHADDPKYIGPWIIGECVGKGASGRVKIAKHRRTGQLAAVKILPLQPLVNSRASLATQQAKSDKQRLGIDREITMMKLMNHPNIMRIYDVYEGKTELYLVLEYIEGGELFDFLVNRGHLPAPEALMYFKQILYGLSYAHAFSIIHRDLKPENILIHSLSPPLIKIADWGMAALAPPSMQLETSCGSPHYASPEIVNGDKYEGTATDIWSCGVILYALLAGRLPFDDKNVRHLLAKVKVGKYELLSHMDPQACDLLSRMLVVDVTKRITIPEILAHPWLASSTPGITYVPAPPVHELARPLYSSHIDRDLFASLRIIWGRHADPSAIRADLLSPPGQGTLAKAFYFLLAQYRERTMLEGENECVGQIDGAEGVVTKQYIGPGGSDNLKAGNVHHSTRCAPAPPGIVHPAVSPQRHNISGLAPPVMEKTGSSSSRSRPPSPAGPRPSSVYCNNSTGYAHSKDGSGNAIARGSAVPGIIKLPDGYLNKPHSVTVSKPHSSNSPEPRDAPPGTIRKCQVSYDIQERYPWAAFEPDARPQARDEVSTVSFPRPAPRRRNTCNPELSNAFTSENRVAPPPALQRRGTAPLPVLEVRDIPLAPMMERMSTEPTPAPLLMFERTGTEPLPVPPPRLERTGTVPSPAPPPTIYAPAPVPVASLLLSPTPPSPLRAPSPVASPAPTPALSSSPITPLTMLTAPRTNNPETQRTMDNIADQVNMLLIKSNAQIAAGRAEPPSLILEPPMRQSVQEPVHQGRWSWHDGPHGYVHVSHPVPADSPRGGDKENARVQSGRDQMSKVNGLGFMRSQGIKDDSLVFGDSKSQKRDRRSRPPNLDLQIPPLRTKRSTRAMSVLGSPVTLGSPVVGEVKGWFSNLFSWKSHTYVLYTHSSVSAVRAETTRLLGETGVVVAAVEDGMLRCRLDDTTASLKFRVEFSGEERVRDRCAIVLVQEKGPLSVFRVVCKRLREEWRSDGELQSPAVPLLSGAGMPLMESAHFVTAS